MTLKKITLTEKLAQFDSHWDPHVVADYNGNDVMVVKVQGEFPFHKHDDTDDFFLILDGEVILDGEDGDSVTLGPGEMCIVPKGMTHRPRAASEATILLIEPKGEPNTGNTGLDPAKKPRI